MGNADIYRRDELAQPAPGPEVLGTIPHTSRITDPSPAGHTTTWTREDGTVMEITEPAPPWETQDERFTASDARRFVECPPQWRLHWVNPRLLESEGWRDWQAVSASDPRVTVRVKSMVSPENYIRRGGATGDILCWMWQGHHEIVKRKMRDKIAVQTQSAKDKQAALKEEFARGTYGPYLRVEGATHPTHTQAEGRSMNDV
jgi:hypothetical protein